MLLCLRGPKNALTSNPTKLLRPTTEIKQLRFTGFCPETGVSDASSTLTQSSFSVSGSCGLMRDFCVHSKTVQNLLGRNILIKVLALCGRGCASDNRCCCILYCFAPSGCFSCINSSLPRTFILYCSTFPYSDSHASAWLYCWEPFLDGPVQEENIGGHEVSVTLINTTGHMRF